MCGIAGVLDLSRSSSPEELTAIARAMGNRIQHRGPDEGGEWIDAEAGLVLAHRRLSIIDLSSAGRQPMTSASGRYVLAYNGEIYNFRNIRAELESKGYVFRGHSDTEVLLEAIDHWGLEKTLPQLVGMFAIALWDKRDRSLTLIRDRIGIKPLYWGRQGDRIFFGSELKSLRAHPDFYARIDRAALSELIAFNYIPGPNSAYENICQLEPGCHVHIDEKGEASTTRYWNLREIAQFGAQQRPNPSVEDAEEELNTLLGEAVQSRMVSDVPLGALLSGGIDSSTVTSLMQASSRTPVKTFSIGFDQGEFNEADHARSIADHLGTEHHELIVSGQDALDVIPKLSDMFCEPFADSSQIPTHLVSAMARKHVTVALSGDGGDETFAGYNRYLAGHNIWPRFSAVPTPVRRILACLLMAPPSSFYDAARSIFPEGRLPSQLGDKIYKLAGMLRSQDLDDFYARVVRFWDDVESVVINGSSGSAAVVKFMNAVQLDDPVEKMQALDMFTYLPGDILTKVDRASMAVGLEARVPLLDHRVIEFSWSLPMDLKIRNGKTKWLLRRVLDRYVPANLVERPKAGFAVPLGEWLRGPLREWAEDLLSEASLRKSGLFHPEPVRKKWAGHLSGRANEQYALWSILMAQDWERKWISG